MKGSRVSKVEIAGQAAKRMLKFMCVTCVHAFIRGISNMKSAENRQPQEREREERERGKERERDVNKYDIFCMQQEIIVHVQ